MKLPRKNDLESTDMNYLYGYDTKEFFSKRGWTRYLYANRFYPVVSFINKVLPNESIIVDIGCAQGNFSLTLAGMNYKVFGVDIRPTFLKYAKLKIDQKERENVNFIAADAFNLPFSNGFADCVLLPEILEHVAHPEKMVKEALRILQDNGYLIISTVNGERFTSKAPSYTPHSRRIIYESSAKGNEHVFEFNQKELTDFLQNFNLEILEYHVRTPIYFYPICKLFTYQPLQKFERVIGMKIFPTKLLFSILVFSKKLKIE